MGHKCYYKNWMHMTLMILILFPLIDLIKHSDAHNQSAEFNTSEVVGCLQTSNCGLSNQSRSIDITKNNTVPDDIIDDNTVAIEKDKNSTNTEDDLLNSSKSSTDMNDFSDVLSDGIIESEIPKYYDSNDIDATTEDEFLRLLEYADLNTEKNTLVDTTTDKNYLETDILNTQPNIEMKNKSYYSSPMVNNSINKSVSSDLNDSPVNLTNTESHNIISSVYLKHLNTSTAKNITKELLKTKMNFEKILDEDEKKNDVLNGGDSNVTEPRKFSPGRKGSLAFVFDATGSMWDDLVQLRRGAELILETMLERDDKPIQNYVLVPFRDPDVGPVEVSTDDTFLTDRLENLSVFGGLNCPEKSLSGIIAALNVSLPYSFIYVFTDATADDYLMVESVIDLVQKKHSQIVFVLTGDCKSRDKPGYKVYEQIAAASSGQVFRLQKHDVFNVVQFVKDSLDASRVNLGSSINPPGKHEHKLTIDNTLKEVTVSVAGNKPVITVTDPQGKNYDGPPKIIPVLDLSDVKVVNIIDPEPGSWTLTVGSPQNHSVKVTGLSDLHFDYGFSVHPTEKMSETNNRPLSGAQNNLMISIDDDVEIDTLKSVELLNVSGETLYEVPLEELNKKPNEPYIFRTFPFLPPSTLFYIAINGVDLTGNSIRRISSTGINPQLPEKPIMEVQEEMTGHIHSQVVLQCKVQSMVPITVWWFRNGIPVMSKQEHVQTATVEYLIVNLDESTEGRYVCKASNTAGHSAASVNVILTADPPKVELLPLNTSALSGQKMTLECYVESQMPVNVQIVFQRKTNTNGLTKIKDVGVLDKKFIGMSTSYSHEFIVSGDTEGLYTCSATNKGGTSQAESMVNVLPPLKVEAFPKIIEFEKGGTLGFSCIIHGTTDGRWVALNNDIRETEDLDWDITRVKLASGGVQMFMDAKNPTKKHEGTYDCYGFRGDETAHNSVESRYVEAPSLIGNQENFNFELGSTAIVDCNVTGIPPPIISWYQPDGKAVVPETEETKRIYVKASELIIHNANPVDDGRYVCEAENQFGVAKRTVTLSVWEKPTLKEKLENRTINIYDSTMIPCKVTGVPIPLVAWYKENMKLINTETTAEGSILVFNRIDVNDEGKYTCLAENQYGILKEDTYIQVSGLEKPIVTKGNKSIILKEGDDFQINCGYTRGKPLPFLYWQKEGGNISDVSHPVDIDNSVDETDDTNTNIELIMNNISHGQEGNYSCIGRNILGEDRYDFFLEVQRPPKFTKAGNYEDYEDYQEGEVTDMSVETTAGSEITLNCDAVGKPKPLITWSKDGTPVVFTNIVYVNAGSNLVISGVRESDSGHYTCLASNPVGNNHKNFTVNVLVKPTILNERTDPVLQTIEGQMVVLPCSVYAVPAPQVTWLFNEEHILPSDRLQLDSENTLRFVANLTDSGVYQCQAINKAGNSSQEYLVLVFVPPYIYPSGNEVVKATEGSYIVLNCHAIGFPQPSIIWTKNGHALSNDSSDIILNDSGRLNITKMTKNNSGTFICEAENYAGFSEKIFYIVMNEVPNILPSELPVNIQLLAGEDEFNIPCRASGNPTPYISWMKDGKYILNDLHTKVQADGTLTLRLVTEDLSGKYTCQAANTEGSIEIDYHIQVVAPPTLLETNEHGKNVIALEGSTANLECPLRHSSVLPNIQWYKNSDLIDENENKTILKLINVSRHDASEYSCLASNAGGKVSATFKLIVQWPPIFISGNNEDSEHVHILEGEPMKLACNVDANPAADVQWLRNLEMIGDISPVLRRNFVKTHHAGEHMCVASNPHGQIKKNFIVDVSAPPTIDGPESVDMAVRLGQPTKLDCFAKGFPKPDIEWAVKYAPDWDVIGDGRILKAFNISKHSEGVYSCVAKNKVGSASKQFNISVTEPPRVPIVKVNVSGKEKNADSMGNISLKIGSNVSLSCASYGDSPSSVIWIRNGVILNDSESLNTTKIYFENLQPRDSGKYTCLSKNNIGSEEYDINIDVLVLPEILNDGSNEIRLSNHNKTKSKWKTVETLERQSIKLNCRAHGNPVPDIYWFKDKNYMGFYDSNVMTQDHGQVLFIKRVSRVHAGNYTCVARNSVGEDKLNFKVDVWVSPYVEQQKEEGGVSFVAKRGQNVHLECPVSSNPKPSIRWLKHPYFDIDKANFPHIHTKDDNTTLVINNVTVADNGNYSCIGTNIVGMMEMLFTVEVVESPIILDEEPDEKKSYMFPNGTVIAKIRRGFQLTCNAVAHPEPEINWYKDGFRLYNSFGADSLHISRDGRYLNVVDASLGSAGKYVCNAHNKVGEVEKEFLVKILVPAEWGPWTQWSECSTMCGSGQSTRKRECQFHGDLEAINGFSSRHTQHADKESNNGSIADQPINDERESKGERQRSSETTPEQSSNKSNMKLSEDLLDKSACRGNETEARECFIVPCKVNGGWSAWGEWTSCSVRCGAGSRRRYRSCSVPHPQHGGAACVGADAQQEPCEGQNCSHWLSWSPWNECSVTCGKGVQMHSRKCDGPADSCLGLERETRTCLLPSCPVRGMWGSWSDWSPCSVTCGTGQRRRWRECRGGGCTGGNLQIEKCLDIRNSCNKYVGGINNAYGRNKHNKALLNISGKLNGFNLPSKFVEADIFEKNGRQYVQTSINDVLSKKDDYLPFMSFMISPTTLDDIDKDKAYQNNPLASSRLRMIPSLYGDADSDDSDDSDDSQIQFATGEQVHLYHRNQGISKSGEVMVDIIIDGNIPTDYNNNDDEGSPAMLIAGSRNPLPITELRVNTCSKGYSYSEGSNECKDINECELPINSCHSTQMCENLPGSYRCLCQHGYMSMGIGQRCLDVNECLQNTDGCSHDCVNTAGNFYCTCPNGLHLTGDKKTCVKDDAIEDITEWLKGFGVTGKPTPTTNAPVKKIEIIEENPDSIEDGENILLTRISPTRDKSKPYQRKSRPHKHNVKDDYDYGVLSPFDEDEYADYYEGKGRSRISKQSNWSQPIVAATDDEKDTYDLQEKKKNVTEPKNAQLNSKLNSFFNLINTDKTLDQKQKNDSHEDSTITVVPAHSEIKNVKNHSKNNKKDSISTLQRKVKMNQENYDDDDDSYEDEDSYVKLFEDSCPEGFYFDNNKCHDIDECTMNMNSCNGVINMCINTRGSYACVPTPCPELYQRSTNGSCEQRCDVRDSACSEGAALRQNLVYIIYSTSIYETPVPGTILNLNYGGKQNNIKYTLQRQPKGETFYITTEDKMGTLHTLMAPSLKRINRIIISSKGSDEKGTKLLYYTKFIVYLYIWE